MSQTLTRNLVILSSILLKTWLTPCYCLWLQTWRSYAKIKLHGTLQHPGRWASLPLIAVKLPSSEKVLSCALQYFTSQSNSLEIKTWSIFKFYSRERERNTSDVCLVQWIAWVHELIFSRVSIDLHYLCHSFWPVFFFFFLRTVANMWTFAYGCSLWLGKWLSGYSHGLEMTPEGLKPPHN